MYHKKEIKGLLPRDSQNLMGEGRQVYNCNAIKHVQLERQKVRNTRKQQYQSLGTGKRQGREGGGAWAESVKNGETSGLRGMKAPDSKFSHIPSKVNKQRRQNRALPRGPAAKTRPSSASSAGVTLAVQPGAHRPGSQNANTQKGSKTATNSKRL